MSLVNDMLRDLDQRRQEPGRSGFGAERLVPAVEERAGTGSRSLFSFALAVVVSLLLIVGGFYFWQSRTMISPASEPAFVPNVPAAASQQSAEPLIDPAELELMALRMQELEAQNRALMDAQAALSAQTAAAERTEPLNLPPVQDSTPEPESVAPVVTAADSNPRMPEPAVPTEAAVSVSSDATPADTPALSTVENTSGLIRSPRTLSFAERDQMQAQDAARLVSAGQTEQAIVQLREFIDANPNAHVSRETIVKLALQRGDLVAAQTLLDAGLSLEPNRPGYRKLQARMLLGSGQAAQAVALLSSRPPAIAEDIEFHDLLATAYLSSQNYESAAHSYEMLVQQNRSEARWWYGLATSWDALGRARDAALAYEQAMKLPSLSAALRQRSQQRITEIGL